MAGQNRVSAALFVVVSVLAVTACAFLLARQAAASVERFREEDHVRFGKRDKE